MENVDQNSRGEYRKQRADDRQPTQVAIDANSSENKERRNPGNELARFERDNARNHDPRGNGSQGREQGLSQLSL